MDTFKLTTVEENEAATARLLETGALVGADSWQQRVKNQTPHCKFGEEGACCRICSLRQVVLQLTPIMDVRSATLCTRLSPMETIR